MRNLTLLGAAAILAGSLTVGYAQQQNMPSQPPSMDEQGMQGGMGMMTQMNKMMENCNKMMENHMQRQNPTPQQDKKG